MMIKNFVTPAIATAGSIDSAVEKTFGIISAADLTESRQNDVLLGRGSGVNTHPGNSYFRSLVKQYKQEYVNSPAPMKKQIIVNIIGKVVNQTPPGRFLKLDNKAKQWQCIRYFDAKKKTGQALREDQSKLRTVKECTTSEKEVLAHRSSNVNNRKRAYSCGEDDSRPTSRTYSGVAFPKIAGALEQAQKTGTFDPTYMFNPHQYPMGQMKLAAHLSSNVNNRKRAYSCGEDDTYPTSRSHGVAFPSRIAGALEAQEAGAFDPTYMSNSHRYHLAQMNLAANMLSTRMPLCPNAGEQYNQYTDDCFFPNAYARFPQQRARPKMQRRGYKSH
mmetsp:Transcript_17657/g.26374  ORF Transcript_17657/g.26374 Transcript_17657/m.26374 type:complete len:331 (+) Transcript_17657:495-1487(+)